MRTQRPFFGILAAAIGFGFPIQAQVDPDFYVFLAFGQSNMEGQGKPFPASTLIENSRFKVMSPYTCSGTGVNRTKEQWAPAITPIVRCNTNFSLLDNFGRTLVDSLPPSVTIGVVPVAVAGTAIRGFSSTAAQAYYASQETWMKSIASLYGNNPYASLVSTAKAAQKTGVIKGILLHQGETDAYSSSWRDSVKAIYTRLLSDLGLKATEVPLLAGEVAPTGACKGANPTIDGLPKTISTSYVISSSATTIDNRDSQNVHFDVASYSTLGKRYAQQMLKLLPKSSAAVQSRSVAIFGKADFVVYDVEGARVGGFSATDAATLGNAVAGIRKDLPIGVYWVKNASTGASWKISCYN